MNMLALTAIILPLIGFWPPRWRSRGRWSEKSLRDHWRGLRWSVAALVTAFVGIVSSPTANGRSASRCGRGCRSVTSTSVLTRCWTTVADHALCGHRRRLLDLCSRVLVRMRGEGYSRFFA